MANPTQKITIQTVFPLALSFLSRIKRFKIADEPSISTEFGNGEISPWNEKAIIRRH